MSMYINYPRRFKELKLLKEFEEYINSHDFASVRYNYHSNMEFAALKEDTRPIRIQSLSRTKVNNRRKIYLLGYNKHYFTKFKYKCFTGIVKLPFTNELDSYVFFHVASVDANIKECIIFNSYNRTLLNELYFNKLKYIYETLTNARSNPENLNILTFPVLEKAVAKESEPLEYIFEADGIRMDFDSIPLPKWDSDGIRDWDYKPRKNFIRGSYVMNLMADIFIQLGIDPKRQIKNEVKELNYRCRKEYTPEVELKVKDTTTVTEAPSFDPNKDYKNPISDKLKGVNHPGFKVYN